MLFSANVKTKNAQIKKWNEQKAKELSGTVNRNGNDAAETNRTKLNFLDCDDKACLMRTGRPLLWSLWKQRKPNKVPKEKEQEIRTKIHANLMQIIIFRRRSIFSFIFLSTFYSLKPTFIVLCLRARLESWVVARRKFHTRKLHFMQMLSKKFSVVIFVFLSFWCRNIVLIVNMENIYGRESRSLFWFPFVCSPHFLSKHFSFSHSLSHCLCSTLISSFLLSCSCFFLLSIFLHSKIVSFVVFICLAKWFAQKKLEIRFGQEKGNGNERRKTEKWQKCDTNRSSKFLVCFAWDELKRCFIWVWFVHWKT